MSKICLGFGNICMVVISTTGQIQVQMKPRMDLNRKRENVPVLNDATDDPNVVNLFLENA